MRRRRAYGRCLHRSSDDPRHQNLPGLGSAALFSRLRREQLTQVLIDLAYRIRIGAEQREMSVNSLDRARRCRRDTAELEVLIHSLQR
jgi:hypothetical protein